MKKPKPKGRKPISGREWAHVMRAIAGDYFDRCVKRDGFMPSRPHLPAQTRLQWVNLHWRSFRDDAWRYFWMCGRFGIGG